MSSFDTQIHPEETSEYSDYVDAQELAAIEAEVEAEVEAEANQWDEYDSFEELANQYDDSRDLDFYES